MTDQEANISNPESDDATLPVFLQGVNRWGKALDRIAAAASGTAEERGDQLMAIMQAAEPLTRAAQSHHFVSNTESLDGTRAAAIAEENLARALHDETVPAEARSIYAGLYPEIFALPLPPPDEGAQSDQV